MKAVKCYDYVIRKEKYDASKKKRTNSQFTESQEMNNLESISRSIRCKQHVLN